MFYYKLLVKHLFENVQLCKNSYLEMFIDVWLTLCTLFEGEKNLIIKMAITEPNSPFSTIYCSECVKLKQDMMMHQSASLASLMKRKQLNWIEMAAIDIIVFDYRPNISVFRKNWLYWLLYNDFNRLTLIYINDT